MSYVNPTTGRSIKRGAATWRRLVAQGHRVVADRLLRHEHADIEERAIDILGESLNLPLGISNERIAALSADLDAVRNQPGIEAKADPQPDPLSDADVGIVFDNLNDVIRDGATVRWTSRTPREYAAERIPAILDAERYYTFEVEDAPYTFPIGTEPSPPLAAMPGDEVTTGRINAISDLFEVRNKHLL